MWDLIKFAFPLMAPKNYAEILAKLASFVFWETYIATFFLRTLPPIHDLFMAVEAYGPIGQVVSTYPALSVWNVVGGIIAFVLAGATHVVKFHDKISDVLGIRHDFDQKHILFPLAELVGVQLTGAQRNKISERRDSIMRDVFYRYASSRAENPIVDLHDIQHALIAWSTFWVLVEGAALFLMCALISIFSNGETLVLSFSVLCVVYIAFAVIRYHSLGRYSRPQIEAIASNDEAAEHVRAAFNAL